MLDRFYRKCRNNVQKIFKKRLFFRNIFEDILVIKVVKEVLKGIYIEIAKKMTEQTAK